MPTWLGTIAEWNPHVVDDHRHPHPVRQPGRADVRLAGEHAIQLAILWPLVITAITLPLAVRAFQRLSR